DWFLAKSTPPVEVKIVELPMRRCPMMEPVKDNGDAEASDAIEPLIVMGGFGVPQSTPVREQGQTPRVQWTFGVAQSPRPDADPGRVLRMPYADEEEDLLVLRKDPVTRLLDSDLPRLD